jgi:hypothetical protein
MLARVKKAKTLIIVQHRDKSVIGRTNGRRDDVTVTRLRLEFGEPAVPHFLFCSIEDNGAVSVPDHELRVVLPELNEPIEWRADCIRLNQRNQGMALQVEKEDISI